MLLPDSCGETGEVRSGKNRLILARFFSPDAGRGLITKWPRCDCPSVPPDTGGFHRGPGGHAGAGPQMNARLCPLPGRLQGLPGPSSRGFVSAYKDTHIYRLLSSQP